MNQIYEIARLIIGIYRILIFVRVIISFIPHNPNHPALKYVYLFTEPILGPFRKLSQQLLRNLPIDISPIFALILLDIISRIITGY